MPKRFYRVAAVEVGERSLATAWGRLAFVGPNRAVLGLGAGSWSMDLETISYGHLDTGAYTVGITLRDGRTLTGEAVLTATNGRLYHFDSRGEWADLDDDEPAREEHLPTLSSLLR